MSARTDKGYRGAAMEGGVARWYAANTGRDRRRIEEQAADVLAYAPEGGDVLEIAPGPGYLAVELARTGRYTVTAVDISATFVHIAREQAARAGVEVAVRQGNAADLAFDDASFDFVVCCAAFKNFSDPAGAVAQMHRVLRPGGRALIQDLRPDVTRAAVHEEVARMNTGVVSGMVTRFVLGTMLPRRAHSTDDFDGYARRAGFASWEVGETPVGFNVVFQK